MSMVPRCVADSGRIQPCPISITVHVAPLRRYEFQADAFAVDLGKGEGLKGGLLALESTNRSAANVDPLFSAFTYSHPPVPERLQAIDERMKKGQ